MPAMPAARGRFIPAHAGNSASILAARSTPSVHPRACGEQRGAVHRAHVSGGSSPRMRGTGANQRERVRRLRFIPAHAGNSARNLHQSPICAVHPRACGEQQGDVVIAQVYDGSSPRMRGTEDILIPDVCPARFIPAHAGNSSSRLGRADRISVHPRACGEQRSLRAELREIIGSSPRMRGTAIGDIALFGNIRFIPAHAGNSRNLGS